MTDHPRTTKKLTITTKGYQLYDSAFRILDIRNNLLENFTGSRKQIIDLAASTILSARSVVDLQKTKQILLFPLEESAHKRSFYIVYSKNRILKSHVRQFIHYVKEYYQTV